MASDSFNKESLEQLTALKHLETLAMSRHLLFLCDKGKKYTTNRNNPTFIEQFDQLDSFIQTGHNIGFRLKSSDLLAFDIDNPEISKAIINLIKHDGLNCLITSSPRNCHVYFSRSDDMSDYRQGKVLTPLGFECELFRSKDLVYRGPSYKIVYEPKSFPLCKTPFYMRPVTQRSSEKWIQSGTILKDGLIHEGNRNNSLFYLSRIMKDHPQSYPNPKSLITLVARFFCSPPYTGRLDHMVSDDVPSSSVLTDSANSAQEVSTGDKMKPQGPKATAESIVDFLGLYTLTYKDDENSWYQCKDNLWELIVELDLRTFLFDTLTKMGLGKISLVAMKNLMDELRGSFKMKEDNFLSDSGIGFLNGFYDIDTR